ncbi:hypothetical protein M501DRAFT_1031091 [Patellaria atrata CBS 101060]|uniref:Heterokaryon incompatibility domain-containing protein n=1 Tax=Patellaria atrata CBS 101060 TaxID=1346257 RepID=A0A9P4SDQ2_9PEZI|nr:hypothetical protein M501DRAFT_1031091 [Patellaria atrata CBS 101060]
MTDPSPVRTIPNDYQFYRPLDISKKEIRLLRLLPAVSTEEHLVCALIRTSLDDAPPFQALSYCWGNFYGTRKATVMFQENVVVDSSAGPNRIAQLNEQFSSQGSNKQDHVTLFNLTATLHTALVSFLLRDAGTFLWADMLCINQGDPRERSDQVGIMHLIYKGASSVVVWLGGDPKADSRLFLDEDSDLTYFMTIMYSRGFNSDDLGRSWTDMRNTFIKETLDPEGGPLPIMEKLKIASVTLRDFGLPQPPSSDQESITESVDITVYYLILWLHYPLLDWPLDWVIWYDRANTPLTTLSYGTLDTASLVMYISRILQTGSSVWEWVKTSVLQDAGGGVTEYIVGFLRRVSRLASCVWFHRIWVFQEVAVNSEVYVRYDSKEVPWQTVRILFLFQNMARIYQHVHNPVTPGLANLSIFNEFKVTMQATKFIPILWKYIHRFSSTHSKDFPLLDLLERSIELKATDDRDKVFAIYHLATDIPAAEFSPDYTQTVQQAFSRFTSWVIDAQRSLLILTFVTPLSRRDPVFGFPSWVPDYANIHRHFSGSSNGRVSESIFRANGDRPLRRHRSDAPHVLQLEGIPVALVVDVLTFDDPRLRSDFSRNVTNASNHIPIALVFSVLYQTWCLQFSRDSNISRDSEETLEQTFDVESFTRLLYREYLPKMSKLLGSFAKVFLASDPDLDTHQYSWKDKITLQRWRSQVSEDPRFSYQYDAWEALVSLIWGQLAGWSFFFSHTGRIGLCPTGTKAGDIIVVLGGGPKPYALREKSYPFNTPLSEKMMKGPRYEFLGECYLEGSMYGESINGLRDDPLHEDPLDPDPNLPCFEGECYLRGSYKTQIYAME